MDIEEFNYYLPENLIAQTPLLDRSAYALWLLIEKQVVLNIKLLKI